MNVIFVYKDAFVQIKFIETCKNLILKLSIQIIQGKFVQ